MLLVLDVNETLLDLAALDDLIGEVVGVDGPRARRTWFDRMIRSALTITAAGEYVAFGTLAGAALRDVAAEAGRVPPDDQAARLTAAIGRLPAHPDVAPGLRRLREAGHRIVALTNSVREVAEAQLASGGLIELLDGIHSADEAGLLKPAPQPYRMVL